MALWAGLHCQLHVLIDVLLGNLCCDQSLGLEIKRISIHHPDPLSLSFSPGTLLLFQHLCKLLQITTLKSLSQSGIVLFKQGQLVWFACSISLIQAGSSSFLGCWLVPAPDDDAALDPDAPAPPPPPSRLVGI